MGSDGQKKYSIGERKKGKALEEDDSNEIIDYKWRALIEM